MTDERAKAHSRKTPGRVRCGRLVTVGLAMLLAGCETGAPDSRSGDTRTAQATASPSANDQSVAFPTRMFAEISDGPVTERMAIAFQEALADIAGAGGMSAMVMSADGTWGGTAGTADGVRPLRIKDQFNIGSISKTLVAAQVMQLVEAGELDLDDLAADHLPADLEFDTNSATIRHLLNHRSGIPDYWTPDFEQSLTTHPRRDWTTEKLLKSIPDARGPVDVAFAYSSTNYVMLGLAIEHVRGRALVEVLRNGVLDVPGTERLISQPEERPTAPMAMPSGASAAALQEGGGYLPSTASVTSNGPGAVIASDAPSLAHWWRALCAGEIVSHDSLNEMTEPLGEYGLGLYQPYPGTVGHRPRRGLRSLGRLPTRRRHRDRRA